ncbi:alpha/beta hydrolase [Clostridium folliculivorans]|uniref:Alpha/beta hydrolase n=1 Tax=Clostridium folliculivorans TaxID=2886038 RepID=A0A9W5Y0G5_9CLOT|nr:alpha/beta hydrolase [Clostridium folliculivorans]GKU24252.1 alpha/beta hydrolase [Clostridium folliculivorans]
MKVKFSSIDKDLRNTGRLLKLLNNTFTEPKLRFMYKMSRKSKMKVKDKTIQFSEEYIVRNDGSRLRICIFKPLNPKKDVPGVLWLHGGGYALGAPEVSKLYAKKFIEVSDCIVIAPDYRLSIEAPYPAALEDSYEALLWMKNHAEDLGIRSDQLMVGGDSAGGGLTAALTLYARDKGEVNIAFQMPLYPMIDDRMTTKSAKDNDAPVWNSKSNFLGWKLYLGSFFATEKVPYYAAAARSEDYSNLPPTATFVGNLEPFRDETIDYVENLKKAGIPVHFEIFNGCYHGFDQICPKAEVTKKAHEFLVNSFKYATENYFAEQNTDN